MMFVALIHHCISVIGTDKMNFVNHINILYNIQKFFIIFFFFFTQKNKHFSNLTQKTDSYGGLWICRFSCHSECTLGNNHKCSSHQSFYIFGHKNPMLYTRYNLKRIKLHLYKVSNNNNKMIQV